MFVVKDAEKSGLKLDGSSLPSGTVYTTIPSTEYVGGFIEVEYLVSISAAPGEMRAFAVCHY